MTDTSLQTIQPDFGIIERKSEPKEMLTWHESEGKIFVRINFSSLNLIQTCKRKAYYALEQGLRQNTQSDAIIFGSAIHASLECWYSAPRANRKAATGICDDSHALISAESDPIPHGSCTRCASIFTFIQSAKELRYLPETDKRSLTNGISILNNYFDTYLEDPFVVYTDKLGPACERDISFIILDEPKLKIEYFGRIDVILQNETSKTLLVTDHKTTSSLGTDFFNRLCPNFQYTGYAYGARKCLGLNTRMFLVNGIQVAKTRKQLSRQTIEITDEHVEDLFDATIQGVKEYLVCHKQMSFPMTTPNPCTMWGGCQYHDICSMPAKFRQSIINDRYQKEIQNETK